MDAPAPAHGNYWRQQIESALLAPIRAMRMAYLPLLMVYFAYGATGLTAVAQTFWIKRDLTSWTPADLESADPNLLGGDIINGSFAIDQQLVFRPGPAWWRWGSR